MARNDMRKSKQTGPTPEDIAERVGYLERQIEWKIELAERFKCRDYAAHVLASMLAINDTMIAVLEAELVSHRRATI